MVTCTDCQISLEPIRLVDATEYAGLISDSGARHVDLSYAPINAEQGWFTGKVKGLLKVNGMICPKCRRISLYG